MKSKFEKVTKKCIKKTIDTLKENEIDANVIHIFTHEDDGRRGIATSVRGSLGNVYDGIEALVDLIAEREEMSKHEALAKVTARILIG